MIWWKSSYKLTTAYEKDNKKERKEILEKNNMITIETRKKIINNQWIENTSTIKKQTFSKTTVEEKNYVFIARKKNIKLKSAEVYNKKNQWKHEHE